MGRLYDFLGLTVGCIQHDQEPDLRREQYAMDITYGTNSEFGFDYLRDNGMATTREQQVQRGYNYAIVDEVDSILIDEARTPLIISGPSTVSTHQYDKWKPLVDQLVRKQNMLCNRLSSDAKELFEKGENEEGGLMLFKVKLGQPRNKQLLRMMEDPEKRRPNAFITSRSSSAPFAFSKKMSPMSSRKTKSSSWMNTPAAKCRGAAGATACTRRSKRRKAFRSIARRRRSPRSRSRIISGFITSSPA